MCSMVLPFKKKLNGYKHFIMLKDMFKICSGRCVKRALAVSKWPKNVHFTNCVSGFPYHDIACADNFEIANFPLLFSTFPVYF